MSVLDVDQRQPQVLETLFWIGQKLPQKARSDYVANGAFIGAATRSTKTFTCSFCASFEQISSFVKRDMVIIVKGKNTVNPA